MTTATKTRPQAKHVLKNKAKNHKASNQTGNIVSFPANGLPVARDTAANHFDPKVNARVNTQAKRRGLVNKPHSQHLSRKVQNPKKLAEASFSLIETADAALEVLMAAKSVASGLKRGETVLLVSPEKPEHLIRKLAMTGLKVESFVKEGKLIIFSSQPAIAGNLSLATNYREVFGELFDLAGCPVDRIVVLKMDLLVNLESQYLAYASVSKFTQAADEMGCKFIAQYSRNQSEAHDRLDAACSSLVNSYFVMKRGEQRKKYQLQVKNIAA